MAKLIDSHYAREVYPHLIGKTLIPKYWHRDNEDGIFVECVENPELSQYVYYLYLDSWKVE